MGGQWSGCPGERQSVQAERARRVRLSVVEVLSVLIDPGAHCGSAQLPSLGNDTNGAAVLRCRDYGCSQLGVGAVPRPSGAPESAQCLIVGHLSGSRCHRHSVLTFPCCSNSATLYRSSYATLYRSRSAAVSLTDCPTIGGFD